jgi:chloramphenicol O-acetyltransferase type A
MRHIDLEHWPRRELFKTFGAWDHPHFNMTANVEVTTFRPFVKELGSSLTIAIVYALTRVANSIPEFRYRLRSDAVVEHVVVHPSTTILAGDDTFGFCTMEYVRDFSSFAAHASRQMAYARDHPTLEDEPGRDDLLYMTAIPWVSFTSFMHPLHLHPPDSIPRFAWGKVFPEAGLLKLPLSVQGHHALMDGIHMGRFYEQLQSLMHDPGRTFGA